MTRSHAEIQLIARVAEIGKMPADIHFRHLSKIRSHIAVGSQSSHLLQNAPAQGMVQPSLGDFLFPAHIQSRYLHIAGDLLSRVWSLDIVPINLKARTEHQDASLFFPQLTQYQIRYLPLVRSHF